jgi:hypothetical protein
MSGLKDYVENNESFPACKLSTELKEKNMAAYCPEKIFVKRCIKRVDNVYESSSEIREAFDRFCHEVGVKSRPNISAYLEEHERLVKSKKRIDEEGKLTGSGNPIYVYEGIRLKKKYRIPSGGEPTLNEIPSSPSSSRPTPLSPSTPTCFSSAKCWMRFWRKTPPLRNKKHHLMPHNPI